MMMIAAPWFRKTVYVIVFAFLLPVYAEAKVYLVSVDNMDLFKKYQNAVLSPVG